MEAGSDRHRDTDPAGRRPRGADPAAGTDPFAAAPELLRARCQAQLEAGVEPVPTVAALDGDEPLALIGLRPFAAGEATQALLEALALVLPLGADRLVLSLPGRAWSLDDPIAPVCPEGDLRQRVLVQASLDGRAPRTAVVTRLLPIDVDEQGATFGAPLADAAQPSAPSVLAAAALLDARASLAPCDPLAVTAQFGRVVLLGHEVELAPVASERLVRSSAGVAG